jgi:hypothetical protein
MQQLTQAGEQAVQGLAQRYGVSADAVRTMLFAVNAGGGSMAQFYCPELGGGGQWMRGGMTMVGDMFNHNLKALVSNLCDELSSLLASQQVFQPQAPQHGHSGYMSQGNNWWPDELGNPSSSGGQNDARYAYFPHARRLAISQNGRTTVYDTLDHQIGGVQQQQGGYSGSLSFSSQFGTFTVESLPLAGGSQAPSYAQPSYQQEPPQQSHVQSYAQPSGPTSSAQSHDEILSALERLGNLHQKGVLSDAEFNNKKSELLSRL